MEQLELLLMSMAFSKAADRVIELKEQEDVYNRWLDDNFYLHGPKVSLEVKDEVS